MKDAILILNTGSSSIKFAIFDAATQTNAARLFTGSVTDIGNDRAQFVAVRNIAMQGGAGELVKQKQEIKDHTQALQVILDWLESVATHLRIVAAGHRVVHGGTGFSQPVLLDETVLAQLKALIPLAPLHQPFALHAIERLLETHPHLPQVACFDTAFHSSMPDREQRFALPEKYFSEGVRRYGFHGLSYEYIVSVLPAYLGEAANGRVVIAHLGHGVSMCAVLNRKSMATSMSFTPLDGLPMGTRSGAIDPAVVLYLFSRGMTTDEISDLLHHQSGLLGLSGISADMQTLLESQDTKAKEAIDYFCYRISRELGSLASALGGLDAVVFTGGIGEHAPSVREKICRESGWLGIELNSEANQKNDNLVSTIESPVSVWMIPTDEEQVIATHTKNMVSHHPELTAGC